MCGSAIISVVFEKYEKMSNIKILLFAVTPIAKIFINVQGIPKKGRQHKKYFFQMEHHVFYFILEFY